MYIGNHTTLLCILCGFPQHLILQHMPVNMILEFLHLFQFSLWQQDLEHLQNINHIYTTNYNRNIFFFTRKTNKNATFKNMYAWEIGEITTLHNFVHLIKLTSNICAPPYDVFKFIYGHWHGSCTSELQVKVNCRIKFGLARPTVGRSAHISSYNSLSVYNSLSSAIHLYMIQPIIWILEPQTLLK